MSKLSVFFIVLFNPAMAGCAFWLTWVLQVTGPGLWAIGALVLAIVVAISAACARRDIRLSGG